ncbi:acyltransferase [Phenylobacterium montanum]|uniref:Acyltransferase n=1 Tax=Phenylobacterium montanum TaxID=2823693 RepID=A0A975IX70_9CAUL|nr:acyltransferase [Caulobacter sp. S6]
MEKLDSLTALRFFPALWVVLFDYWRNLGTPVPTLVAKGYLGVEVFFTLSGFILCHVYLAEVRDGRFDYGAFLKARLARIYPLHLASLAAIGAMALAATAAGLAIDPNILSWPSLPANLLLTQAWGMATAAGWNHPSWSISAEWFAYLAFPLFAAAALRLRRRPQAAVLGAAALLVVLYLGFQALTGESLTQATIRWGALRIVPCFALGCALYLGHAQRLVRDRAVSRAGAFFLGVLGLIFAQMNAPDAAIVLAFGGLIACLAGGYPQDNRGPVGRVFNYLGEISFAIYMLCVPWNLAFVGVASRLFHFDKNALPLTAWLFLIAGLIPAAAAAHHLIERPARGWVRRLGARRGDLAAGVA